MNPTPNRKSPASTIDQARRAALDRFAKQGVTGFTDTAGRRWRLDRYAEMATRTAVGRAQVAGTLDEIKAHGGDLVIVSNHSGTCQVCAPWEAKILSIDGTSKGRVEDGNGDKIRIAGTVADAQAAGLQHPQCRHSLTRFVPGLTVPPEPGPAPTDGQERRRNRNVTEEQERLDGRRRAARTGKAGGGAGGKPPGRPPTSTIVGDDDHDEQVRRVSRAFEPQTRAATAAQRAAARAWQGLDGYYKKIQRAVRSGGSAGVPQDVLDTIAHLDELMGLGSTPVGVVGWRGIRSITNTFGVTAEDLAQLVGTQRTIAEYLSMSLSQAVARNEFTQPPGPGGAALLHVMVAANTPALWLPPLGDVAMAYQQELLVVRAVSMAISIVGRTGNVPLIQVRIR